MADRYQPTGNSEQLCLKLRTACRRSVPSRSDKFECCLWQACVHTLSDVDVDFSGVLIVNQKGLEFACEQILNPAVLL